MGRRIAAGLILIAILAVVWLCRPSGRDERAAKETAPTAGRDGSEPASPPSAPAAPPRVVAEPAPAGPVPREEPAPGATAATDSSTKPVVVTIDALPFERSRGNGFVKIGFDDLGRLEVEAECEPERVFTFDVYATIGGKLEWLAGNDGVADLQGNLKVGNRKYLTQRHWSRLHTTLTNHGVESGADVEVRVTYFDLEGRKQEEERYRLTAP